MMEMHITGCLEDDAVETDVGGKKYYRFNVAHLAKDGSRHTVNCRVYRSSWIMPLFPYLVAGTYVFVGGLYSDSAFIDSYGLPSVRRSLLINNLEIRQQ